MNYWDLDISVRSLITLFVCILVFLFILIVSFIYTKMCDIAEKQRNEYKNIIKKRNEEKRELQRKYNWLCREYSRLECKK